MSWRVELVPWQGLSPAISRKWRECLASSDNFRACLQTQEWVDYRWGRLAKTFVAILRDGQSDDMRAVTPLVQGKFPLIFSIAGRNLSTVQISGLLLNGNMPLYPQSDHCYEALCSAALAMPSVDCLYMLGVPLGTPFWSFLSRAREAHPEWLIYTPYVEPHRYLYIDMSMSHEEYLRGFKRARNRRRQLRILEQHAGGKVEVKRVRSSRDARSFLDAARTIAQKSWQGHFIDVDVTQQALREEVLESMAQQGLLRAYLLRSEDAVFAFMLGFQLNEVYYLHEMAFDPAYARFSPGQTLLYLAIKDCFEVDPPLRFHFGPGESFYKYLFTNRVGEEQTVVMLRRNMVNATKIGAHALFRNGLRLVKTPFAQRNHESTGITSSGTSHAT